MLAPSPILASTCGFIAVLLWYEELTNLLFFGNAVWCSVVDVQVLARQNMK